MYDTTYATSLARSSFYAVAYQMPAFVNCCHQRRLLIRCWTNSRLTIIPELTNIVIEDIWLMGEHDFVFTYCSCSLKLYADQFTVSPAY